MTDLNNDSLPAILPEDTAVPSDTEETAKKDISDYADHFALKGIDKGSSRKLLGNVCIVAFFVHDIKCAWKKEEKAVMKEVLVKVVDEINSQSKLPPKKLSISYAYDDVPVQLKFDADNYYALIPEVLKQYGDYQTVADYSSHYKKKFSKKEVPIVFFFHRDFRSFAHMHTAEGEDKSGELSFVSYRDNVSDCVRTLLHELLHQFGAIDYYLPEKVKQVAERVFENSIMNGGMVIDPLTRYIIGWDEEPDDSVFRFLEETKDVTPEEILEARIKDSYNDW